MSLILGKQVAVTTNYIKSNPAIPIYKGGEDVKNLFAYIYHIEIGYSEENKEKIKNYLIIDYKEYKLSEEDKNELISKAKEYSCSNGIQNVEIFLIDNEEAETFVEKLFDNMKIIRGLTQKRV
ncbi:hypothetical protein SAMN05661008_00105 [Alkalithermobacter thermoalcaliphilus JW-YL-7 = DSM 7308]|uniref:Uncharacterized protein n=1 Tax=Alkalithermobacter thermoalcaliphilus JW-YL-7 = DSM 7308 TaxID=1121328 RepID=A0A150FRU4_CLOPD|nr:hypothetical protein JWYL7_1416 [[Clostridium] paradoxum JW-YL-7 = DSM 7308]SHK37148.1 hypothetical protein SAMN05661008_00105 [[Clostridium] paradoxum JW-YL-7 = DSM 7308]